MGELHLTVKTLRAEEFSVDASKEVQIKRLHARARCRLFSCASSCVFHSQRDAMY